jgi:hypothetical protein
MDRGYWQKALRQAERELEAARTLSALNAAAKRLMLARRELELLEHRPRGRAALTVVASRRAPLHDLLGLVDLETRSLQVSTTRSARSTLSDRPYALSASA